MDHITYMQIKKFEGETNNRQIKTQINVLLQTVKIALQENVHINMTQCRKGLNLD